MLIVHGFGENSDLFIETAMTYALNSIDVHMLDLTGFGYSGGKKMAKNNIETFMVDITDIMQHLSPSLPLFLYGHSMGGLTLVSFLINNNNLNIAGVILSAPFLAFTKDNEIDNFKRVAVRAMSKELDNLVLNPMISLDIISRDLKIL